MKNIKLITIIALLFVGSTAVFGQEMGYVNLYDVAGNMQEKKDADVQLKTLYEKHQAEIKKQEDALLAIEKEVQEKTKGKSQAEIQSMMTDLQAKQQDYQTKQQALYQYQQAATKEVADKEEALMKPINDKIQASISKVAVAKGLKYVVDSSVLLYANGADITADVKKEVGVK